MRLLRRAASAVDRLNDGIGAAIRWLALLMVIVGAYNAVARYLTRSVGVSLSSNAYIDLQWYMFSAIFLLGAAYGLSHDVHVRVDVLYARLRRRTRAWIDLVGTVLFLVPFSVLMLWVAWPAVRNSWSAHEVSPDPGGLPRYPVKTLILISFALLLLQALAQIVKQIDVIRGAAGSVGAPGAREGDRGAPDHGASGPAPEPVPSTDPGEDAG